MSRFADATCGGVTVIAVILVFAASAAMSMYFFVSLAMLVTGGVM